MSCSKIESPSLRSLCMVQRSHAPDLLRSLLSSKMDDLARPHSIAAESLAVNFVLFHDIDLPANNYT